MHLVKIDNFGFILTNMVKIPGQLPTVWEKYILFVLLGRRPERIVTGLRTPTGWHADSGGNRQGTQKKLYAVAKGENAVLVETVFWLTCVSALYEICACSWPRTLFYRPSHGVHFVLMICIDHSAARLLKDLTRMEGEKFMHPKEA